VNLTESGAGGARIRKTFAITDLNYNDADWAISCWVKRNASTSADFVWHMGEGNGTDSTAQLSLYFPTNGTTPKVAKYGTSGLAKEIVGPALPNGSFL
jgi:hypothetical protein